MSANNNFEFVEVDGVSNASPYDAIEKNQYFIDQSNALWGETATLNSEEEAENAALFQDNSDAPAVDVSGGSEYSVLQGSDVFSQIAAQNQAAQNPTDEDSLRQGVFSSLQNLFGTSADAADGSIASIVPQNADEWMNMVEQAAGFLGLDSSEIAPLVDQFKSLVEGGATAEEALQSVSALAGQLLPQETAGKVQSLISTVAQSDGDITQTAIAGAASLLGFSSDQADSVQNITQLLTSGQLTKEDGSVNWDAVAGLAEQIGGTGLLNKDFANTLGNALQSVGNKDYIGAIGAVSSAIGLDGAAVQELLAPDASIEQRIAAAAQLGLGINLPPEAIEQAVQGVKDGDFSGALNLLASATGNETISKIAQGAEIVQQAVALSDSGTATAQDWVGLGQSAAAMLGLSEQAQNAIGAVPEIMDAYKAISSGESFDYGSAGATALKLAGLDEQTANALGDSADVILDAIQTGGQNLNVSSVAGAIATVSGALGAPKEVGAVATALQGALAGGISGYGAIASAVGQIIGGETGAVIGKVGAYAACAASGPVGWAAGAVMLTMDLFGVQPPRESLIPTQNTAFLAQDENGNQTVRAVSQTGGQSEIDTSVTEFRREDIVQRPDFLRDVIESRTEMRSWAPGGNTLLAGEAVYSDPDGDGVSDARMMMDPEQGGLIVQEGEEKFVEDPNGTEVKLERIDWEESSGVNLRDSDGNRKIERDSDGNIIKNEPPSGDDIVKKSDGDGGFEYYREVRGNYETEWTTTARFGDGAPAGSVATLNQETGQIEIWAKADSVFTGLSDEQAQSGYIKYWESTSGKTGAAGQDMFLEVTDGGNLRTRGMTTDGSRADELTTFTSESDGGFFSLGASYTDDDQGKLAGRSMEIEDPDGKLNSMGFLDNADQIAQLIQRVTTAGNTVTDIQVESEDGDEVVLYDKGDGSYLALDRDEYDERVSNEGAALTLPPGLQPQAQQALTASAGEEQGSNSPVTFANPSVFINAESYELFDDDTFANEVADQTNRESQINESIDWDEQTEYELTTSERVTAWAEEE